MDGINRIPRPALALGTLALFVAAMVDPLWFGARMTGIALVPEPLWWLLGVIVSFYFGARHQVKGQAFQRELAQVTATAREINREMQALDAPDAPGLISAENGETPASNPALEDWRRSAN